MPLPALCPYITFSWQTRPWRTLTIRAFSLWPSASPTVPFSLSHVRINLENINNEMNVYRGPLSIKCHNFLTPLPKRGGGTRLTITAKVLLHRFWDTALLLLVLTHHQIHSVMKSKGTHSNETWFLLLTGFSASLLLMCRDTQKRYDRTVRWTYTLHG
jgi:hypothetical protein